MDKKSNTIAIMRPRNYLTKSREMAQSMGYEVFEAPMIELADMKDDMFDIFTDHVLSGKSDYVIFTSANGIDYALDKVDNRNEFTNALNRTKVIAIGPNTKKRLEELDIGVLGVPGVYSSEGLVEYLCPDVKGKIVDTARSAYGSILLIEGLEKCGASVLETQVYTLVRPEGDKQRELIKRAAAGDIAIFAFTSSMMVRNFFSLAEEMGKTDDIKEVMKKSIVAAIGTPTANTIQEYGVETTIKPCKYTFDEMLKTIKEEYFN
ncbi:MAG: uroporphyrinogen-III synthase [Methanohalophilus sp.]